MHCYSSPDKEYIYPNFSVLQNKLKVKIILLNNISKSSFKKTRIIVLITYDEIRLHAEIIDMNTDF